VLAPSIELAVEFEVALLDYKKMGSPILAPRLILVEVDECGVAEKTRANNKTDHSVRCASRMDCSIKNGLFTILS
jgi:hypothetical protein